MCKNLSCYQPKIDCYKYKFYINLKVITKQNCVTDIQNMKRKESKHTTIENYQIKKNRAREEERDNGT